MAKFAVGDELFWSKGYYRHVITKVDKKFYYYTVFEGERNWTMEFLISDYETQYKESGARLLTKLEKALK